MHAHYSASSRPWVNRSCNDPTGCAGSKGMPIRTPGPEGAGSEC